MHDPAGRDDIAGLCAGNAAGVLPVVGPDEELGNRQAELPHGFGAQEQRDKARHHGGNLRRIEAVNIAVHRFPLQVHRLVGAVRGECPAGQPAAAVAVGGIGGQQGSQRVRLGQRVVIHDPDGLTPQLRRGADAVGKAARTAEVFPRIAADQPRHCQRLYIVRCAVSGRIVHQQHRKALHGLGTQGGQALFEQRQTVVGHDDGRDISCVKHLFSGRICA